MSESTPAVPQTADGTKPTNPKDGFGILKTPFSTISSAVISEVGVAMLEGALKYGRHNYREAGVLASVYYDATVARHLTRWWEGEDIDLDSCEKDADGNPILETGINHITKAIASLTVLRDSMIRGNWIDDRPPKMAPGWQDALDAKVKRLLKKYPNPKPAVTQKLLDAREAAKAGG
jgi:hypothetical protein